MKIGFKAFYLHCGRRWQVAFSCPPGTTGPSATGSLRNGIPWQRSRGGRGRLALSGGDRGRGFWRAMGLLFVVCGGVMCVLHDRSQRGCLVGGFGYIWNWFGYSVLASRRLLTKFVLCNHCVMCAYAYWGPLMLTLRSLITRHSIKWDSPIAFANLLATTLITVVYSLLIEMWTVMSINIEFMHWSLIVS